MRNARFWVYCNGGPVKLTLRPGETLEHSVGGRTDEGYSHEHVQWKYPDDEPVVYWDLFTDGRDCDGRHSTGGIDVCPVDRLLSGNEPYIGDDDPSVWEGVRWPDWKEHKDYEVYDEYAQLAGY